MGLLNRINAVGARLAPLKPAASRSERPILSISFDDFPRSAWTVGGLILEAHGVKATYYVAGRFSGCVEGGMEYFDRQDLAAVAGAGHEVGCHTFSHRHSTSLSTADFQADRDRNRRFLETVLPGGTFDSFAYPFGDVSVRVKSAVARSCATARGIRPGVNGDPLDLALLLAAPMERRSWRAEGLEHLARRAADTSGWLILFTHDVSESPSPYGCTPAMLEAALAAASRHGLAVMPIGAAAKERIDSVEAA